MSSNDDKPIGVQYLDRDFDQTRSRLLEYIRQNFPETYQDFNEASSGMMLVELMAYATDILNFYVDHQVRERTLAAREAKNVINMSRRQGYAARPAAAASGFVNLAIIVPSSIVNGEIVPLSNVLPNLKAGSRFSGGGTSVEITEDCNFSNVENRVFTPSVVGSFTNLIVLKQDVPCVVGRTTTNSFAIGAFKKFNQLTLQERNVADIIDVYDSANNRYYEVENLSQDMVFVVEPNVGDDVGVVPSVLKLVRAPRRFVKEYDPMTGLTRLTFGGADGSRLDQVIIPDVNELALPLAGRSQFPSVSIDPQNFLRTTSFGVGPANTTLTMRYRVGGGFDSNVGSNQITSPDFLDIEFPDPFYAAATLQSVKDSVAVSNPSPIIGGDDGLTISEMAKIIPAHQAAQNRVVTAEDFVVRAMSMPASLGSVFRARAAKNEGDRLSTSLWVISRNAAGTLVIPTSSLKDNLKKYMSKYKILSTGIDILNGKIINIGVDFEIVARQGVNKNALATVAINRLLNYFDVTRWQMGQQVILSEVMGVLAGMPGVLSVASVNIHNLIGTIDGRVYSTDVLSIRNVTRGGIIHTPANSLLEIKFDEVDVRGVVR